MRKLALIFSAIYQPLIMTTILISVMLWYAPNSMGIRTLQAKWILVGIFALLTFVLPMISIILLKLTKNITRLEMDQRKERIWPLIFTSIYYGVTTYWMTYEFRVSTPMIALLVGVFITLCVVTIITMFWKISIHSAGAWGGVGFFVALMQKTIESDLFWPTIITVILAGAISSARLYLNVHNPRQILVGGLIGFAICFTSIYLFL